MAVVGLVDVLFEASSQVRLVGWSGVLAGKVVYDALSGSGVFLERGGGFRVSPVYDVEAGRVAVGFLVPGRRYRFRVVVWGRPGVEAVALSLGVAAPGWMRILEVRVGEEWLEAPEPLGWDEAVGWLRGGAGERTVAVYEVAHGPTFYRHYGAEVVYPSPHRMWPSILRRLAEALAEGGGRAPDYRPLGLLLQEATELVSDFTRKFRIPLSHGKKQRVFQGRARYRVAAPPAVQEAARRLLEASRLLGLGGTPGLGLGHVEEVKRIPGAGGEEEGEPGGDAGDVVWG